MIRIFLFVSFFFFGLMANACFYEKNAEAMRLCCTVWWICSHCENSTWHRSKSTMKSVVDGMGLDFSEGIVLAESNFPIHEQMGNTVHLFVNWATLVVQCFWLTKKKKKVHKSHEVHYTACAARKYNEGVFSSPFFSFFMSSHCNTATKKWYTKHCLDVYILMG